MRPEDQIADIDAEIDFLWKMRRGLCKVIRDTEHKRRERDKRVAEREERERAYLRARANAGLEPPTLTPNFDLLLDILEKQGRLRDARTLTRSERGLLTRMENRNLVFLSTSGFWVVETHADIKGFRAGLEREHKKKAGVDA